MKYRNDKYGNPISVLGYGCMRFSQKAGKIDLDKLEYVIRYLSALDRLQGISITGGEPLVEYNKLFQLLDMIYMINPNMEIQISTNDTNLLKLLDYPKKENNKTIEISDNAKKNPNNNIHLFLEKLRKGDTVYIHPEAEYHPSTTLQKIINAGMVPGIAINPGTSVETVIEMLRIVKRVLVMSVNPGNAGQMYLPYVGKKIARLLDLQREMDFELFWDGACSAERIREYAPQGMQGFVLGSTLLFGKKKSYEEILKDIRALKF